MQRRLKILPSHFNPISVPPPEPARDTAVSLAFSNGIVVLTLLSYLHVALNELLSPSNSILETCLPYRRDPLGCAVVFVSLFLWFWTFIKWRDPTALYCTKLLRPSLFIYWGAFLNMSIKPVTWLLSFQMLGCAEHFSHQAIGRVGLASYALLLAGACETLDILQLHYEDSARVYAVCALCAHVFAVVSTCYVMRLHGS